MKKGINKKTFFYLLMSFLFFSCKESSKDQSIFSYSKDKENGLMKEVTIGEYIYKIQYKPSDYILQLEGLDEVSKAERTKQLDSMVWFNISISILNYASSPLRYGIKDLQEYNERLDYYLNSAEKDIELGYGNEILSVFSYWFENNQNLKPEETIVVGFKLKDTVHPEKDMHLSFNDRVFNNGIVKTVIRANDIKRISN